MQFFVATKSNAIQGHDIMNALYLASIGGLSRLAILHTINILKLCTLLSISLNTCESLVQNVGL